MNSPTYGWNMASVPPWSYSFHGQGYGMSYEKKRHILTNRLLHAHSPIVVRLVFLPVQISFGLDCRRMVRKHSRKDLLQSFFPSKKPEGFGHLLSCFHRNRHRNIPRPCTSARKRMGTCRPRSPQRKGTRNDAPVRTPVPTFLS